MHELELLPVLLLPYDAFAAIAGAGKICAGMEVPRRLPGGIWVFFMDHLSGADPSRAIEAPPHTE